MNAHPTDEALIEFNLGLTDLEDHLASDGEFSAADAAIVARLKGPVVSIEAYRRREDAGASFARNGLTQHTVQLFIRAGHRPEDMRRHRLRMLKGGKQDLDVA